MKIKTIKGHLTATDKKVIKHMLLNKMDSGSTNKKDFFIKEKEQNFYSLTTIQKEWDCDWMRNKKVKNKYNSTFKLLA